MCTCGCVFFFVFFFSGGYSCGSRSYFSAETRRHLFEVVLLPFLKMFGNRREAHNRCGVCVELRFADGTAGGLFFLKFIFHR